MILFFFILYFTCGSLQGHTWWCLESTPSSLLWDPWAVPKVVCSSPLNSLCVRQVYFGISSICTDLKSLAFYHLCENIRHFLML